MAVTAGMAPADNFLRAAVLPSRLHAHLHISIYALRLCPMRQIVFSIRLVGKLSSSWGCGSGHLHILDEQPLVIPNVTCVDTDPKFLQTHEVPRLSGRVCGWFQHCRFIHG